MMKKINQWNCFYFFSSASFYSGRKWKLGAGGFPSRVLSALLQKLDLIIIRCCEEVPWRGAGHFIKRIKGLRLLLNLILCNIVGALPVKPLQ